ncbi:hypothetical protein Tco_1549242 [Tanacetum coccineum]
MDKGLTMLSEVALIEAEQLKLVIERSKTQTHISHASGSGADEGTGSLPGVPDVPTYDSDDEQISWKSSEEDNDDEVNVSKDDHTDNDDDVDKNDKDDDADNQDDENPDDANQDDEDEQTDSDNDGDDFVHPKLPIHDDEARKDDEVNEKESNKESDDESNEEVQGANTEDEEMDEEATHEEDEANELYRDVNVNLEGRDTVNSRALLYVPVTTIAEPPLMSAITLPPPPTPLITHMQQTPVPTLTTQTNKFSEAISSIPDIVDAYLANKMHEAVKTDVQLQSEKLRDEAQAKNADFLNKLDDNIKKIIKDQVKEQVNAQVSKILPKIKKTVNEQLEAEVMTRSSTESKTSLAIAANLSELELKKILIDKIESNKSIHRSDEQKNLYKALVEAYESDKLILDTYGDTGSKRRRAGKETESTSTPKEKTPKSTGKSTEGSKSLHKSAGESAHAEDPINTTKDLEEPAHQEFETGATEDKPVDETPQPSDCIGSDLVPTQCGVKCPCNLRQHANLGISHWGRKRQQFYGFAASMESARDVYYKRSIIAITKIQIIEWHGYKHLDWITVRDVDKAIYFKEETSEGGMDSPARQQRYADVLVRASDKS